MGIPIIKIRRSQDVSYLKLDSYTWKGSLYIEMDPCVPRLNIQMPSCQYNNYHYEDKTAWPPSYLYNGNPIPENTVFTLRRTLLFSRQYPSVYRETVLHKDDRGSYINPYVGKLGGTAEIWNHKTFIRWYYNSSVHEAMFCLTLQPSWCITKQWCRH